MEENKTCLATVGLIVGVLILAIGIFLYYFVVTGFEYGATPSLTEVVLLLCVFPLLGLVSTALSIRYFYHLKKQTKKE